MIRFSHSVFALPFAYSSAIIAGDYADLTIWKFILITAAMVGARSVAMGMNRIIDRYIDARNPRTDKRAIPAGRISTRAAYFFVIFFMVIFIVSAALLNTLTLVLSPLALVIVIGYSYTKRYTWLNHYALGASLAVAPMGAWLGVTGEFHYIPFIISTAVLLWAAGFDIIYSFQDYEHDKKVGLYSVPVRWGIKAAYNISSFSHFISFLFLASLYFLVLKSYIYLITLTIIATMLIYQHVVVDHTDDDSIERAFFQGNSVISVIFLFGVITCYLLR
jgi:4-hydroxybenzoate polyprenyltransferase